MAHADRFPSPFEVPTPPGAENWRGMYDWYHVFCEDRRKEDEGRFWFHDRLHHPDVMHPYDEIQCECWWQALGAFNTRIFAMPPAFGVDQRVLNGYLYVTAVPAPPEALAERVELFERRAGHYYENWDEIYAEWKQKVLGCLERITAIHFAPLPEVEPEQVVFEHTGHSSGYRMIDDFSRLVSTMYETYQYHFEMLNIGYAAYLTFFTFMRGVFPEISEQAIARMVGGLRVDLYRPDDELKRLAKSAVELGIAELVLGAPNPEELFGLLQADERGRGWVEDWHATADPWFLISTDPGHPGGYHTHPTWKDEPAIPLATVKEYVRRLRAGETIDRPTEQVLAERDRITAEYRDALPAGAEQDFERLVSLARKVFAYIEEHVLYIEHWMWATFWARSKELAAALTEMGAFDDPEDMFLLRRTEVAEAIYDVVAAWSVGTSPRGVAYWRPIVAERQACYRALCEQPSVPALGPAPAEINEPLTVMLWGITTDTVAEWLARSSDGNRAGANELRGAAGSPGVVEGPARVVRKVTELEDVREGEILVCPATSPAWSTVFARIAATVSDVGGIMSHTAIVCREYGLPAVVGVGTAMETIKNGQRIRVDGDRGVVTILE